MVGIDDLWNVDSFFLWIFVKTPEVSQEPPCDEAKHTSVACVILGTPRDWHRASLSMG